MLSDIERDADCTNASRGVWLIKVPKYISEKWKRAAAMSEAGRLNIDKLVSGRTDITFRLSNVKPEEKLPSEHKFVISNIQSQLLAIYSQEKDLDKEGVERSLGKISIEGAVVQKGECRPIGNDTSYINLKRQKTQDAGKPKRTVIKLDRAVNSFKPVARHSYQVEFEARKKTEGKRARGDRDQVLGKLFAAFEKHQYYTTKSLEELTKQPEPYLKELLHEICNFNLTSPHRHMWELKLEYRHYKVIKDEFQDDIDKAKKQKIREN